MGLIVMDFEDRLAHEKFFAIGFAYSQTEHTTDAASGTVDRFTQAPSTQIDTCFSTATDVAPEPVEILFVRRAFGWIFDEVRVPGQTGGSKIFADHEPVVEIGDTSEVEFDLSKFECRFEAGKVGGQSMVCWQVAVWVQSESDSNGFGSVFGVEGVLDRFADQCVGA